MDAVGIDDTWLAGGCFDSEAIGWTLNRKKEQMGGGISAEKAAHKMEQFDTLCLCLNQEAGALRCYIIWVFHMSALKAMQVS